MPGAVARPQERIHTEVQCVPLRLLTVDEWGHSLKKSYQVHAG